VADSLLKQVRFLKRTQVYAIPGATIERLTDEIYRHRIDVSYQKAILLCIGTNNLSSNDTAAEICAKMASLVDMVRSRNTNGLILVSGIVIRPCDEDSDYNYTRKGDALLIQKRRDVNDLIDPMLAQRGAIQICTWKSLMKGPFANRAMYGDDRLHLSDKGVRRITQFLINSLGNVLPRE
jgi:lysophospholipase L1-like esterase